VWNVLNTYKLLREVEKRGKTVESGVVWNSHRAGEGEGGNPRGYRVSERRGIRLTVD